MGGRRPRQRTVTLVKGASEERMTFLDAERLWLLVGTAVVAGAYVVVQRRRRRDAVRFAAPEMLANVAPDRPGWRRHLPAVAFLAVLALLITAFARPAARPRAPRERATIMIALDTSGSMVANDVKPNRLAVAKQAALAFVERVPARFNVGLVSFNSSASVVVPPGTDREAIRIGIQRLHTRSLTAIANLDPQAAEDPPPAHIVLLSDGGNTTGRPIEQAAQAAAEAHVPVSTIAYGTPDGRLGDRPVPVDPAALRQLAEATGGTFYQAASGEELQHVYQDVGTSIGFRTERRDMSSWFVGLALLAALGAAVPSLFWFSRLP